MAIILIDGKPATSLVSCHRYGRFTYHDGVDWVERVKTVPRSVLDKLPADERARVVRRLAEAGDFPV